MRRLVLSAAALLAMAGTAAPADTQEPSVSPEARLRMLFSSLGPSDEVQIVTPLHFVERAQYEGIDGSSITVRQDGAVVPLDFVDIRAVSVRSNHQWQGALWGLGTGLLVGSVTGMMVASFDCTSAQGCNTTEREGAIRWGSVFGAAGAVTGFVIGRTNVYWRPLFP